MHSLRRPATASRAAGRPLPTALAEGGEEAKGEGEAADDDGTGDEVDGEPFGCGGQGAGPERAGFEEATVPEAGKARSALVTDDMSDAVAVGDG